MKNFNDVVKQGRIKDETFTHHFYNIRGIWKTLCGKITGNPPEFIDEPPYCVDCRNAPLSDELRQLLN